MPKQISTTEYDLLMEIIEQFPEGALLEEIGNKLAGKISKRTLQRRLEKLIQENRLRRLGKGRASRYHNIPVVVVKGGLASPASILTDEVENYIPISSEAAGIKQLIRRPLVDRHPVGYQREFLDSYQPNKTWYLSEEDRYKLSRLGTIEEKTRPAGTYANQILNRLLIDLSWNSSRLEGNTYSLLETEQLLELGEVANNKDASEAQMILNHKAAIELLVDQAGETGLNSYTILNLHAVLADNLLGDPQAGGRIRTAIVDIGGTVFHPLSIPQLIEECFHQMLATAVEITDPFEQSFFIMVHLPYLQPFIDVNKRVSRLAANIPFIQNNLCPLSFVDVPERAYFDGILGVYEINRVELLRDVFLWAYTRSAARYSAIRQSMGEPDPFRMRYRQQTTQLIQDIIRQKVNKRSAVQVIKQYTEINIDMQDRHRFIEITETELMCLHAGNIARYRIRPSEFMVWQQTWKS